MYRYLTGLYREVSDIYEKNHLLFFGMFLLIGLACGLCENFLVSVYVFGSFAVICYYAAIYIGINDKIFIKELKLPTQKILTAP